VNIQPGAPDGVSFLCVRPEIAMLCALANGEDELHGPVISVVMSMMLVQAVSLSQGTSPIECDDVLRSKWSSRSANQIGLIITLLAATYSRLSSPKECSAMRDPVTSRHAEFLYGKVSVGSGLALVSITAFSKNL